MTERTIGIYVFLRTLTCAPGRASPIAGEIAAGDTRQRRLLHGSGDVLDVARGMQAPMTCPRDHGLSRHLCPVQKKQGGDGAVGEMVHGLQRRAAAWQEARQDERPDQRQGKVVRQELGSGYAGDLIHSRQFSKTCSSLSDLENRNFSAWSSSSDRKPHYACTGQLIKPTVGSG